MRQIIRWIIGQTPLYCPLRNWWVKKRQAKELRLWESTGRSTPVPHIAKQRTLRDYADRYGLKILVETGTYYGDMVEAMKSVFDRIYSIELNSNLYKMTRKRFKGAGHIELIQGDSATELGNVISKLDKPALFWLDGHYSGGETAKGVTDTPVDEELRQILCERDMGHVIIIDDAGSFGTDSAYPTIEGLKDFIRSKRQNLDISVQDDIIRITPASADV